MNLTVQYVIIAVAVAAAGWTAWRILTGRRVWRLGRKAVKPDSCAGCGAANERRR